MDLSELDVVILCGGLGTRLGPITENIPKVMVPIGDKPFLELVIESIGAYGFRRFVLCTGYKAEAVHSYFQKQKHFEILYSPEEKPLGTAGAIKHAQKLIRGKHFLALNGDSFCPMDYAALVDTHLRQRAWATLVVVKDEARADGGRITMTGDGKIVSFDEKPPAGVSGYLSAGIYAFDRILFEKILSGGPASLEKDIFPRLCGKDLYGCVTPEELFDIGTPERLERFREKFKSFQKSSGL